MVHLGDIIRTKGLPYQGRVIDVHMGNVAIFFDVDGREELVRCREENIVPTSGWMQTYEIVSCEHTIKTEG